MTTKGSSKHRILIFQLNWMGDILFSFPFIKALARNFPGSSITCAVSSEYADIFKNVPWVSSVIEIRRRQSLLNIADMVKMLGEIKNGNYNMCFLLKPSRTRSALAAAAGIKERIGHGGKRSFLTRVIDKPSRRIHRSDGIFALANGIGIEGVDGKYEYFLSEEDLARSEKIMSVAGISGNKVIAINPGGNWSQKRWIPGNFVSLGKTLLEKFDDIEIAVTGSKKDTQLADGLVQGISTKRCFSFAGKTGINELAALFSRSLMVISADSGPLHLASAVGVPTIGIFGPTLPEITGQRGGGTNITLIRDVDCPRPCYVENCEKNLECMRSITVEDVYSAACRILSENRNVPGTKESFDIERNGHSSS